MGLYSSQYDFISHRWRFISHNMISFLVICLYISQLWFYFSQYDFISHIYDFSSDIYDSIYHNMTLYLTTVTLFLPIWLYIAKYWLYISKHDSVSHNGTCKYLNFDFISHFSVDIYGFISHNMTLFLPFWLYMSKYWLCLKIWLYISQYNIYISEHCLYHNMTYHLIIMTVS